MSTTATASASESESTIIDGIEYPPPGYVKPPHGGDPCPRCGLPMASCSPSGRGTAACDGCQVVYGDD